MEAIHINTNFCGKLFSDVFSDIVPNNPELKLGETYDLFHKGFFLGVVEVRALRSVLFCRMSDVLSNLYCGRELPYLSNLLNRQYNQGNTHKADDVFMHVVYAYQTRNMDVQRDLLHDWWVEKVRENQSEL